MTTNYLRLTQGFQVLTRTLAPYVARELRVEYGENWWSRGVLGVLYDDQKRDLPTEGEDLELISTLDVARCLRLIDIQWRDLFGRKLKREHRTWINELIDTRNKWAHHGLSDIRDDDAWRALDTMTRLVQSIDTQATEELHVIARAVRGKTIGLFTAQELEKTKSAKGVSTRKYSNKKTTEQGYNNKNNQTVIRKTDLPGNDHNQKVYVLRCNECLHEYGANGSDIWLRRCPNCQGGAAGLSF